MITKRTLDGEVVICEPSQDSKPDKLRYDIVVKQVEINKFQGTETKKNVFIQLKSRIKLEKGPQVLTLAEGVNEKTGKGWVAVEMTTPKAVK